ncbi:CapA family protein [Marinicrinis lubricantis]|uniref:CapA family protein n=1 Tax=Marinicrinis lubricantis TaxID=2086470 RepID=A0ABW1IT43_9BACL
MISRKEKHQANRQRSKQRRKKELMRIFIPILFLAVIGGGAALMMNLDSNDEKDMALPSKGGYESSVEDEPPAASPDDAVNDTGNEGRAPADGTEDEAKGTEDREEPSEDADPEKVPDRGEPTGSGGSSVSISFVGDVMFSGKVEPIMEEYGYDYPYSRLGDSLSCADITVANLETPISLRGEPIEEKEWVYRSSPDALPALAEAGVDLVNLANNHILDYGWDAFYDTFDYLNESGIEYVGAGKNEAEAYQYKVIEQNGIKVAFLGFSRVVPEGSWKAGPEKPGVAETYDYTRPVQAIEKAEKEADVVVVLTHWGDERSDLPNEIQSELSHRYIDAGADLVVGGHPHVLQGFEPYEGKWIAYSLGNFIFTTNTVEKTWETVILNAECSKTGDCSLSVQPILTKFALPTPMEPDAAKQLLERLSSISIGAEVDEQGDVRLKEEQP